MMRLNVQVPRLHKRSEEDLVYPGRGRSHPEFSFGGTLDEVPAHDAVALAEVTRLLLRHGDAHSGRPAHVRVVSNSETLSLNLNDPECSLGCLVHTEEFAAITTATSPRPTHLSLDDTNGLQLQWLVPLAPVSH